MLFNSIQFLVFFPIVVLIYFLIPKKVRYIWLLLASYYFYMGWNAKYALLLLFSTVVTYISGIVLGRIKESEVEAAVKKRRMNLCVAGSFAINLGVLFWFKYFDFAVDNINYVLAKFNLTILNPSFDIILPVGISFFTFQALSYTMDVYRGDIKAERNFLKYALFVSFFPQLVAGPIERSKNLLKQIDEDHPFDYRMFCDGIYLMLWGYFLKMVLADRIAIVVDQVYGDISQYGGMYVVIATVLFAFQIYCDFAGYSTIAMGAAKVMGFRLMENFNAPYMSQSVAEFWRRWHISLSSWFKDYLYIPLGGSRKGKWRTYLNILIVFAVSGLWHGASWTFVIWGVLNAIFQIVGAMTKDWRQKIAKKLNLQVDSTANQIARTLVTFALVDFAWIFFRAESVSQALQAIKSMLTVFNPWILFDDSLYMLGMSRRSFGVMIFGLILLIVVDIMKYKGVCIRQKIQAQDTWFRVVVIAVAVWFILTVGIWGPAYDAASFIYFQF